MLTLILLISLTVICAVACFLLNRFEFIQVIAFTISVVSGITLIITVSTLANRGQRFENTIEQYENVKCMADDYNSLPDSCKFSQTFEYDIRMACLEINNIISEHKVMCKSLWVGPWYSERIGKLEKVRVYATPDRCK